MLKLAAATGEGWLARALAGLDELLVDHAHCEMKAAGSAIRLVFRYPRRTALHAPLSRLAREELVHFEQVLERLAARGTAFGPQRSAPYAGLLRAAVRPEEPERLLDTLLVCALIEARSCERFQLLAGAAPDAALRDLYGGLLAAEARHRALYATLAGTVAPAATVRARLAELAEREAEVLRGSPPMVRMHAG